MTYYFVIIHYRLQQNRLAGKFTNLSQRDDSNYNWTNGSDPWCHPTYQQSCRWLLDPDLEKEVSFAQGSIPSGEGVYQGVTSLA
jgi:hypothetical protein